MDLKKTLTDPRKEREGTWIQFQDAHLKIARMSNPAARAAFQEKTRFIRGKISEDKQSEIMKEVLAEHVLIDWENLSIGPDPLPYSKDAALQILKDFPVIAEFVAEESARLENFLAESANSTAEAVKNG